MTGGRKGSKCKVTVSARRKPGYSSPVKLNRLPIALTVAGSDSGGGAGIQADLKTFLSLGVHGTSAITCLTAQNPAKVLGIQPCTPRMLERQLQAIFEELSPAAAKTGMLYSGPLIHVAVRFFQHHRLPLVVDPVMISTSRARLLKPSAIDRLKDELFPLATLLTPNLDEAGWLIGQPLRSLEDLRQAASVLQRQFGCAVLAKGGHLRDSKEAVDVFREGAREMILRAPRIRNVRTHGTGCTLSAAIAAFLAHGRPLSQAVVAAKKYINFAMQNPPRIASHRVLGFRTHSSFA